MSRPLGKLEMRRTDLEAVSALQDPGLLDPLLVDECAVAAVEVLQDDRLVAVGEAGVLARQRRHVGETDLRRGVAANQDGRVGLQSETGSQGTAGRMGDQNQIRLRPGIAAAAARSRYRLISVERFDALAALQNSFEAGSLTVLRMLPAKACLGTGISFHLPAVSAAIAVSSDARSRPPHTDRQIIYLHMFAIGSLGSTAKKCQACDVLCRDSFPSP